MTRGAQDAWRAAPCRVHIIIIFIIFIRDVLVHARSLLPARVPGRVVLLHFRRVLPDCNIQTWCGRNLSLHKVSLDSRRCLTAKTVRVLNWFLRLNFSFVFLRFPLGRSPNSSCALASVALDSRCASLSLHLFMALPSKRSYDFFQAWKQNASLHVTGSSRWCFFWFKVTQVRPPLRAAYSAWWRSSLLTQVYHHNSSCELAHFASLMWPC